MGKLRLVSDNVADRASLSATSQAGALSPANLRTEIKTEVWRSQGIAETLQLTWATQQTVGFVGLRCNFSALATIEVRGFTYSGDTSPAFIEGPRLGAAYQPLDLWEWGVEPLGVNAYAYGGGAYAVLWFAPWAVQKLQILLNDPASESGYLEASRLIVGTPWSPKYNGVYGAEWSLVDAAKPERSESGDRRSENAPRHRALSVGLAYLPPEDRARLMGIITSGGSSRPFFLSVFPQKGEDPLQEQAYQLWGALAEQRALIGHPAYRQFAHTLNVEEM